MDSRYKPSDGGAWKLITNSDPIPPGEIEPQVPPIEPPTTPTEPEPPIGMTTWEINTVYYGGDQVNYNNVLYTTKWWTKGNQPDSSIEWQK